MKKIFFTVVAGIISVAVVANRANAQASVNPEILEPKKELAAIQKAASTFPNVIDASSNISQKALKSFSKMYKDAAGANWYKANDEYHVTFTKDGVKTRAFYGKNGDWTGSLKAYDEHKMPGDTRAIVKSVYYDYNITLVEEVETVLSNHIPTLIVHLENKDSLILLRLYNGEVEVWKEYRKHL